jgi:hypothetical protein
MKIYARRPHSFALASSLTLLLLFRIVLPAGDEPDFYVRFGKILLGDDISPIAVMSRLFNVELVEVFNCSIKSSPFSLTSQIASPGCDMPLLDVVIRWISAGIVVVGIWVAAVLYYNFRSFSNAFPPSTEGNDRLNAIMVTLCFPGFLYFIGLASVEVLVLALSVVALLFLRSPKLLVGFVLLCLMLDLGNTLVLTAFLANFYVIKTLLGLKRVGSAIFYSLTLVSVSVILGANALLYLMNISSIISPKAASVYDALTFGSQAELAGKYNLALRPILTTVSLVFYTPSYVQAPLTYLLFILTLIIVMAKVYRARYFNKNPEAMAAFWSSVLTVIFFTVMLPTYSYGKYYAFLLPILLQPAVSVLGLKRMLALSTSMSFLTVLNILMYRL